MHEFDANDTRISKNYTNGWRHSLANSYMNQLLRVLRILAFTFLAGSQAGYGHESGNDVAELSLSI